MKAAPWIFSIGEVNGRYFPDARVGKYREFLEAFKLRPNGSLPWGDKEATKAAIELAKDLTNPPFPARPPQNMVSYLARLLRGLEAHKSPLLEFVSISCTNHRYFQQEYEAGAKYIYQECLFALGKLKAQERGLALPEPTGDRVKCPGIYWRHGHIPCPFQCDTNTRTTTIYYKSRSNKLCFHMQCHCCRVDRKQLDGWVSQGKVDSVGRMLCDRRKCISPVPEKYLAFHIYKCETHARENAAYRGIIEALDAPVPTVPDDCVGEDNEPYWEDIMDESIGADSEDDDGWGNDSEDSNDDDGDDEDEEHEDEDEDKNNDDDEEHEDKDNDDDDDEDNNDDEDEEDGSGGKK
ncbi:hypothetical protein CHU98_g10670 [Xylaria longipes]|nr:hypothetical protein CHU98_g10670 [Xylaria longipes]